MLKTLRNAWRTPDLRRKILFTLLIVIIFRIGGHTPVPFLDPAKLAEFFSTSEGSIMDILDTFSGGALSQGSLFALAIQPYINASIIMQLLTYALPPLENLSKEGEEGQKKIQLITSIVALGIGAAISYSYYVTMFNLGAVTYYQGNTFANVFTAVIIVACFTTGSQLVVWLGNRINEGGIGSGISIILLSSIISRGPSGIFNMFKAAAVDQSLYIVIFFILVFFACMIGFIVFMNESERRIPVQYAKRVVGRKQYGGQSSYIPVKIAMSGVMPIIFAMALMSFPATLQMFIKPADVPETFWEKFYVGFLNFFNYTSVWYAIVYFLLIVAFNFFYVSMQYDPTKIANQLRQNNGGIPGIRPGKPTSDYIKRVLSKITIVGAFFLGVIAITPIILGVFVTQIRISLSGTTFLIIVSVILETIRMLESQLMMRHHKGFLE